ncbi:MAG: hypothetical protein LBD48_05445 [Treponema sp.]|jgi:hypothetical protein|nr:hypothetical protein [Treponema sp.]
MITGMINIQELCLLFSSHVASCKSCGVVCGRNAAFESWFRVELIPVLSDIGYKDIVTDYSYPNIKNKADLAINLKEEKIVFELKSFVNHQDSNKKKEYPEQVMRLKNLLLDDSNGVIQVITFTTFIGYTELPMKRIINKTFNQNEWNIHGPIKLHKDYELMILITEKRRQDWNSACHHWQAAS